jgi:regulatory protein
MRKRGAGKTRDAYEMALGLLARREHSTREIALKLARKGVGVAERRETLRELQRRDYQNDRRFGEMLVRTRLATGHGPRWILAELAAHGIDARTGQALLEAVAPDWPALARAQLRRRYGQTPPASPAERAKRVAYLVRRGFDVTTVQSVLHVEWSET